MKKFLSVALLTLFVATLISGCTEIDPKRTGEAGQDESGGKTNLADQLLAPPTGKDLYEDRSVLKMTAGKALVKHADGKEEEVSSELSVAPGDTITILEKGAGTLLWFDDSISRLKEGTVMTIDKADFDPKDITQTQVNFHVVKGEIWNKVRGLVNPDSEFLSYSGAVVSGVRGSTYNLIVDGSSVTVESVAHAAFVAPVDPATNAIGKEKKIMRGQLAKSVGAKSIQLGALSPKRLKEKWFVDNGGKDKAFAKILREKNLARLVQRVGALPGESGYEEKMAKIQEKLSTVTDPGKLAELKARLAQLQARESIVLALKNPEGANADEAAARLEAIRNAVDVKGVSDEVRGQIRAEAQMELQGLDRTLEEVLPDTKSLYDIKEALRQQEINLAPDSKATKERMLERRYFELNDAAELPNFTMPADLSAELKNAQVELQKISDFWVKNADFQLEYMDMVKELQANPNDPATIQKLQNYFQDPATQQKLQEAQKVMEQALPTLQRLQENPVIAPTATEPILDDSNINLLGVPAVGEVVPPANIPVAEPSAATVPAKTIVPVKTTALPTIDTSTLNLLNTKLPLTR